MVDTSLLVRYQGLNNRISLIMEVKFAGQKSIRIIYLIMSFSNYKRLRTAHKSKSGRAEKGIPENVLRF